MAFSLLCSKLTLLPSCSSHVFTACDLSFSAGAAAGPQRSAHQRVLCAPRVHTGTARVPEPRGDQLRGLLLCAARRARGAAAAAAGRRRSERMFGRRAGPAAHSGPTRRYREGYSLLVFSRNLRSVLVILVTISRAVIAKPDILVQCSTVYEITIYSVNFANTVRAQGVIRVSMRSK